MELETLRFMFHGTVPIAECAYLMGVSILSEHLKTVATFLINGTRNYAYKSTPRYRENFDNRSRSNRIQESLAFVQGTGLNLVIRNYELDVDPDDFRESFYSWCDYQRRKKESKY